MTLTARAPRDRPDDNRPQGLPDLHPVAKAVEIQPRYWCEMCGQDVVVCVEETSHAAPKEATCGLRPIPMKAANHD